jgi:GxxExxY protein
MSLRALFLDICIKIHTKVGPGCFEKLYEEALYYELVQNKIRVERQILLSINYEELTVEDSYKVDLVVADRLIIEVKSVEKISPVHFKQVRTYLKLLNLKNGILVNFNVEWMKDGFHRVFNNDAM